MLQTSIFYKLQTSIFVKLPKRPPAATLFLFVENLMHLIINECAAEINKKSQRATSEAMEEAFIKGIDSGNWYKYIA